MRAGLLRQRLVLQRETDTDDGGGGRSKAWNALVTVWGRLAPLSGVEADRAQRLAAGVTHEWSIRYSSGVATLTAKDRISWSGRIFQIVSVLNTDSRNREMHGLAKELAI